MSAVITMDLRSAEELQDVRAIMEDDELRTHLADAVFYAEQGDICNDVFLFDYTASYELILLENDIEFIIRK